MPTSRQNQRLGPRVYVDEGASYVFGLTSETHLTFLLPGVGLALVGLVIGLISRKP